MTNINSYKDLLLEEERIEKQIELSKSIIELNVKTYVSPRNLFSFLESKVEKDVDHQFSGEFELKKYLISLSMDFLYQKAADTILKSSPDNDSGVDWKIIAKTLVDRIYVNNKSVITDVVSDFIDKGMDKLKK